jgi:CRISPR-associated endonuclease Cas1
VRTHRFFRGAFDTPPRIVAVDGSGEITLDALDWMHEQGVTFVRLDWRGEVISVASPNGFAGDPEKVAWQRATAADEGRSVGFASDLIARKLMASVDTLRRCFAPSPSREATMESAANVAAALQARPPRTIRELLMIEAQEAAKYFRVWRQLEIGWADRKHPVPRTWEGFEARNVETDAANQRNKNARHPVNAMLNYAYGALESRIRVEAVAEGYDPTLGILHTSAQDKSSFVFDLMEPERPRVDAAVLRLIMGQKLSGADFTIRGDGVCRLNPELARRAAEAT